MGLYNAMEGRIMGAVCIHFGLPLEMPESVRRADREALATEARDLMDMTEAWKAYDAPKWEEKVVALGEFAAFHLFTERFRELTA
jgi:hypothetical protein